MKKNHLIQSMKDKFRSSKEGEEQPDNIVEMPEKADFRREEEVDEDEQAEWRSRNRMDGRLPKIVAVIVVIIILAGIYMI